MIPIRDSVRPEKTPYVNWILIVLNLSVFIWELMLPRQGLNEVYYYWGLVPSNVIHNFFLLGGIPLTFITSIFLHGGWMHVLGNMLFLWVFGDNVEGRLGHLRYLLFYLAVGVIGGLTQVFMNPVSEVPVIGASGAVAGVLGAYAVSFPRARVLALVFIIIMEIPASVFLVLWFVLQLFNGTASLGGAANSVAWWAHVGGFIMGILLVKLMAPARKPRHPAGV
ncbi:MAG: rhomboid family intramembrane serine protease [Bacillota bacterium]